MAVHAEFENSYVWVVYEQDHGEMMNQVALLFIDAILKGQHQVEFPLKVHDIASEAAQIARLDPRVQAIHYLDDNRWSISYVGDDE